MDVGPRLRAATDAALAAEVGAIVAEAVGPVRGELTAERARAGRLETDLALATESMVRARQERDAALADLAACRASHQPTRPWLLAAEAKPRKDDPTGNAGYVAAHDRLNAATGGVFKGIHVFSEATIPGSFGTGGTGGTMLARPDLVPVVNIKSPGNDVGGAMAGQYDARFVAYLDSWHRQRPTQPGWLTIDHEPENPDKKIDAATYRQAWARYARLFLAHPIASHVTFAACFMGWTWRPDGSGRDPKAWDPLPLLTEAERKRVVLAADIYFKAEMTAEAGWADRAAPFFAYAKARGYRTAVFETALNNDAQRPSADLAAALLEFGKRYKAEPSLEMVAYYEATGPAAGTNAWIDTTDEAAALKTWG